MISVVKNGINVEFEAWGNITDSRTLPLKNRWWYQPHFVISIKKYCLEFGVWHRNRPQALVFLV